MTPADKKPDPVALLLPCPHCGEQEHLYPAYRLDKDGKPVQPPYAIDCLGCGHDFTPRDGMDARAAWNRRASPSQAEPANPAQVTDATAALTAAIGTGGQAVAFQQRVQPWMTACFGPEISADKLERSDRLAEEVLELLQSGDYPRERIAALTDYVYGREIGEPAQEVGGVMVTLAAYCLAHDLDMHECGETELARIWTKIEKIRAKQAAKPTGSALPTALSQPHPADERAVERILAAAYSDPDYLGGGSSQRDEEGLLYPGSPYDRGRYDARKAVRAALSAHSKPKGWRLDCATEGCGKPASVHFIRGGIGSYYCHDCYLKVQAITAPPAGGGHA